MNVFTEVSEDIVFVGFHKLECKIHKTYQILVRPDVSEDSVLTLAQQILITYSGAVNKHSPVSSVDNTPVFRSQDRSSTPSPTNGIAKDGSAKGTQSTEKVLSPYLESINTNTTGISLPWQVIRVYLGVNMDLHRCLMLCVQPTTAAAGNNSSTSASTSNGRSPVLGVFGGIVPNSFSRSSENAQSGNGDNTRMGMSGGGGGGGTQTQQQTAAYIAPARKAYLEFCEALALELNTAMREESLTIDYMSSVPASMTGPMQGFAYPGGDMGGRGGGGGSRALDSLIDLNFIRDLHCATAQLMTLRLLEQAERLDSRVKIIEQKCARLMTLLKPSYVRAKLDLPAPPVSKSILTYELVLNRTPIGESVNMELWKLVLLRARRKCREILNSKSKKMLNNSHLHHHGSNGGSSEGAAAVDDYKNYDDAGMKTEAQIVLQCITEQFVDWAQEEYKQRLFRKINCVKDRLETIHRFRVQLILALHERFVVNGLANSGNAITTSSWLFNSNPDLTYQKAVREKFPFLDLTEPVIFDTSAILLNGKQGLFDAAAAALNGKTGTLYVTLGYAMFYSGGGFLSAPPEIVVVALRSVHCLEVVAEDGTLVSCIYHDDTADTAAAALDRKVSIEHQHQGEALLEMDTTTTTTATATATPSSIPSPATAKRNTTASTAITTSNSINNPYPPSAKLPYTIRLVDSAGSIDVTMEVKGLTEDYTRRVADLLDLIVKDKMFALRHSTSPSARAHTGGVSTSISSASAPGDSSSGTLYQRISDIDDIMDLLALPSSSAAATITGAAEDLRAEDSGGRNSESSVSSAGSNNSVIDVEATIAQQRLNAEAAAAASSAHSSESSHQPQSTTAYSDLIDLTVPVAPASEVITQAPPQQPLPAPPVPPIKQSESAHLLELESFFDELSFGINNIASVSPTLTAPAATWATSSNNSPGVVGAGADAGAGVLSKPTSLVSLSGGADQSSHNNSSSAAELGLFDDMLIGTAAAQPSVSAKPEQPVSTTMIAPAITAPVPKSDEDLALSTSGAGVTAAATTAAAPAPSKKSLTGNIQQFLAKAQAQKAKAAADAKK